MLIYIDFSVLSAIRNYDLEGKDSHCVEICTQPDLKGLIPQEEAGLLVSNKLLSLRIFSLSKFY